ncbi:MAG: ribonuclease R [Desulfovibrionaceae bacterium]
MGRKPRRPKNDNTPHTAPHRGRRDGRDLPPGAAPDAAPILKLFRDRTKPLTMAEVLAALRLKKRDRQGVMEVLDQLTAQGRIIRIRNAWGLADRMHLVTGRLEVTRSGAGFVIPDDTRRKDVYVDQRDQAGAWHGDRVVAAITRERPGRHHEGRIVRILERGRQSLPAKVMRRVGADRWLCRPMDPKLAFGLMADASGLRTDRDLRPGDVVLAAPGERLETALWEARVLEILGSELSMAVQEAVVKVNHQVPTVFSEAALAEAAALPERPDEADFRGRKDLRDLALVTIDGETARDFDDAVCVEKRGKGWRLWVAIADVAHYVRPCSGLDREALSRGNSYYFPMSVEPMFPERLSNGLCSLNPDVPRLAMAVALDINPKGDPGEARFYNAVIRSHARLTYTQVGRALLDKDPEARAGLGANLPMLEEALTLARLMNQRRRERGSLDFDLPEAEIKCGPDGQVQDIHPAVRHFGHKLIEEFMVSANEAVARFLEGGPQGCLFRIHPEPDEQKLATLFNILTRTLPGFIPPREVTPPALQALIAQVRGTSKEYLVNRLLLRAMMQAKYAPDNQGHFGLGSEAYCHFTSPIRRYADLVVHRQLKHALGDAGQPVLGRKRLGEVAQAINTCERVSVEAERETDKRAAALFLLDRVGERFDGVVAGLGDQGFWVEMAEVMAEGMVRLSSLDDDYYTYWPGDEIIMGQRTRRSFRMGQGVRVMLESVSLERLEVDLSLAGDEPEADQAPARGRGGRAGRHSRGGAGRASGSASGSGPESGPRLPGGPEGGVGESDAPAEAPKPRAPRAPYRGPGRRGARKPEGGQGGKGDGSGREGGKGGQGGGSANGQGGGKGDGQGGRPKGRSGGAPGGHSGGKPGGKTGGKSGGKSGGASGRRPAKRRAPQPRKPEGED